MGDPEGVDPGKVAAGTLLLAGSPAILVATGHLDSPLPIVAFAALPAVLLTAMWIRTDGTPTS